MSEFHGYSGFVHFVFANEDVYCLPSLMALDLEQYLYYRLKKNGYQGIYFIGKEEDRNTIATYDTYSEELYARSDKSAFVSKMIDLWGVSSAGKRPGRVSVPVGSADQLCRKWFPLLKKEQKLAFVFRMDVFSELFSGEGRCELSELIRIAQQQPQGQKNILIFLMPISAGENARLLLDDNGVFTATDRKNGQPLCWEMESLIRGTKSVKLYEQLRHQLGERCQFLNQFTREQIRTLVRHYYLIRKAPELTDPQWIEDAADVIYCWHHSAQFRSAVGPLFSQNERQVFSQLLSDLGHGSVQRNLEREISRLRRGNNEECLYDVIGRQYEIRQPDICMPADDMTARRMRLLKVRPGLLPEREAAWLGRVIREFQSQRTRIMEAGLEEVLSQCIDQLEEALLRKDVSTVRHILMALEDTLKSDLTFGEAEQVIWKSRKTIIQLSKANFELDNRRKEFLAQKSEYMAELRRLREEIEREEPETAYLPESDPLRVRLASKKASFTQLYDDCRNLDYAAAQDTKKNNQNYASIRKLYLSISAFSQPDVENLSQALQNAQEMVVNIEAERMSEQQLIEDLNDKINYTFKELASMEEYPNTADRYEAVIRVMDQENEMLAN